MCRAHPNRCWSLLLATAVAVLLLPHVANSISVVVQNGFEFHAALTSPSVNWILLADNVTVTLDTCPFPSSPEFPATVLDRNVTMTSLSPAAAAAAAAAGAPLPQDSNSNPSTVADAGVRGPFWLDCSFLDARFTMTANNTLVLDGVVLLNCRTVNTFGYVRMQKGSTLILNNTVDFQGPPSVCIPLQVVAQLNTLFIRPQRLPSPTGNSSQQFTAYVPPGSNWCSAAATGQPITSIPPLPPQFLPLLLANDTNYSICRQEAGLLGNFARTEGPAAYQFGNNNTQEKREAVDILWNRSVFLCREPLTGPCIGANATDACIAEAFRAVDPDRNPPCPAFDAASLLTCLTTPTYTRILIIADLTLNASSSGFPPSMSDNPPVIGRNISLESDARGPRMVLDCALLADRLQVAAGVTVRTQHIALANCTIGAEKPLSFFRFNQGSQLIIQDTYVLQPTSLCLPTQQQSSALSSEPRPASAPNAAGQELRLGQPSDWCAASPTNQTAVGPNTTVSVPPTGSPQANTSYSRLPQVFANRTGLGPAYAASLDQPARTAFYTHPTWPRNEFCDVQVLLLVDYAYNDRFAWTQSGGGTSPAAAPAPAPAAATADSVNATAQPQQQQLPPALVKRLGTGYNGTLPVRYINSTFICQEPSAACASAPGGGGNGTDNACLLAEYAALDPDAAAGAAAAGGVGRNYGLSVILPAVLGSVVGTLLLTALVCGLLLARRRRRRKMARPDGDKGPEGALQPSNMMGVLFGTGAASSPTSTDPARRLLHSPGDTPAGTYSTTAGSTTVGPSSTVGTAGSFLSTQPGQGSRRHIIPQTGKQFLAPDDILLGVAIGSGSFGRVYSGSWKGRPVAVKVISHSSGDDVPISRELSLSTSFDHPNLVRTLHYTRLRLNDESNTAGLGAPGSSGGSSMFLPQGAIGVFDLPSHWAVVQQNAHTDEPIIDTETWIVMDLMDRGTLASAVRRGMFVNGEDSTPKVAMLLRRCADVAAGLGYLHSRNVCHGDLKCENVLLRTEPQDPDGMMASVADFGLSRALALGQSHLSTRRYGTVTHMPPELLVAGKLTPAADIYSFGVMMWEMVSRVHPFAGLHHGEVIHRVVTEDLRPGPWPEEATRLLPDGYVPLAEACWARQRTKRPSAQEVLQQLLKMLAEFEGGQRQQQQQ